MRVNVFIELISKTLMNGLKVFSKFNKSNKRKSLEYYLNFNKIIKETLATTLLKSSTLKLAVATIASALVVLIEIFLNIIGFCRLTVLMNDFRLKTFYCKLTKQPTTSSSSKTTLTFLSTTSSSSTATTSESSSLSITSSNNNHNRTYNNSSKSNKVFLYYTPRDPRLRIFLKTKHFNRPVAVQSQFNNLSFSSKKVFNNRSLFKITDDLCNYGELIGGGVNNNNNCNISNNSNCSNYKNCAVNKTRKLIVNKKFNSANSLNKKITIKQQ